MTAWPLLWKETTALRLARLLWLVLVFFLAVGAAHAEDPVKGEVKVVTAAGYTRLVFRFDEAVDANVRLAGAILVISFKRPVAVAVDRLNAGAPNDISAARRDPDGMAIRIALTHRVKVNSIPAAERFYLDLLPENWSGTLPGLPQDVVDELASRTRIEQAADDGEEAGVADAAHAGGAAADRNALCDGRAGRRQRRDRAHRRHVRGQIRPADQMGSGRRGGELAADAGIDRRRNRIRFGRGGVPSQRHAGCAFVPRR